MKHHSEMHGYRAYAVTGRYGDDGLYHYSITSKAIVAQTMKFYIIEEIEGSTVTTRVLKTEVDLTPDAAIARQRAHHESLISDAQRVLARHTKALAAMNALAETEAAKEPSCPR